MNNDVYKAAVFRVLEAVPDLPLASPPAVSFDMDTAARCPNCGCMDALPSGASESLCCPECQCEFSPRMESVSRQVIQRIAERRNNQVRRFMERLPLNPPGGMNPADYSLFKKIVDGPAAGAAEAEPELAVAEPGEDERI